MKGKTNHPLIILVDTALLSTPEIQELALQGHIVEGIRGVPDYDLILSTKAWRYDPKYVNLAIKAARAAKKEAKGV